MLPKALKYLVHLGPPVLPLTHCGSRLWIDTGIYMMGRELTPPHPGKGWSIFVYGFFNSFKERNFQTPPTPKSFHNSKVKPVHQLTHRNWYMYQFSFKSMHFSWCFVKAKCTWQSKVTFVGRPPFPMLWPGLLRWAHSCRSDVNHSLQTTQAKGQGLGADF